MTEQSNSLAVIGLDARAKNSHLNYALDIDQLERALYQGQCLTNTDRLVTTPVSHQEMARQVLHCVERLAKSSDYQTGGIDCFIVSENSETFNKDIQSFLEVPATFFSDLGQALYQCKTTLCNPDASISTANPIAIIGIANSTLDDQGLSGVVSLLFSNFEQAKHKSQYIYGTIKALVSNTIASSSDIAQIAQETLDQAKINAEDVQLIEFSSISSNQNKRNEIEGLIRCYNGDKALVTALSSVRSVVGEAGGLTQVAGLLKTVIAIQQHYIPGTDNWSNTQNSEFLNNTLTGSAFYLPTESRPWYPHPQGKNHFAAYSGQTSKQYSHIIVEEHQLKEGLEDVRSNGYFASLELSLLLVCAENETHLINELSNLSAQCVMDVHTKSDVTSEEKLKRLSKTYYQQYIGDLEKFKHKSATDSSSNLPLYCIALIAESIEQLQKEINLANAGVSKALAENGEWKTPRGSYFTAIQARKTKNTNNANSNSGKIAFLYPGIGATYIGLGRDLFHLFPQIYRPVSELADDIGETLKGDLLNPRSVSKLDFNDIKNRDSKLRNSLANIAECGVGFACVFTKIFEDVFKIKADLATGYSMGEVSMYAALGCWQQPGLMSARLAQSETFNQRLSGELSTLRTAWQLPESTTKSDKIWETYSVRATAEDIETAASDEDRVFTTIINTPDNLLIGGYPEACERVIGKLGVRAMAMDMPNAIHSEPARAEYQEMERLFTMDVNQRISTTMLSSSCYLPIPQRSKAIANSIAKCLCDRVDFPRLVNALYNRGARIFIEIGAGRSLCSWTDKIIKTEQNEQINEHTTIPVNAKGTSDELTYLRAIAKLVSHGVEMDLESLFSGSIVQQARIIKET